VLSAIDASKKAQMRDLVHDKDRQLGQVKRISVDEASIKEEVFGSVRDRARRLLRLMDCMVASMMYTVGHLFAEPWSNYFSSVMVDTYQTPPLMSVDPKRARETGCWAYWQGNHHVPGSEYPAYPVYLVGIEVEEVETEAEAEAEGEGEGVKWLVKGPEMSDVRLGMSKGGMAMFINKFNQWRGTSEVVLPETASPVTSLVIDNPVELYGPLHGVLLQHAFGMHVTLRKMLEQRLLQRVGITPKQLETYTGHSTFDSAVAALTHKTEGEGEREAEAEGCVPDWTTLPHAPPAALGALGADSMIGEGQRILSLGMVEAEWKLVEEFTSVLTLIPHSAYYGGGVTHFSEGRKAMEKHLIATRASVRARHVSLLGAAVSSTLHSARQVTRALKAQCFLPEDQVQLESLIASVSGSVYKWQDALGDIERYTDALLTRGAEIPLDTHLATVSLTSF
ncbi:hypothetical protein KIPB_008282, partial [Kipferlia bialata]